MADTDGEPEISGNINPAPEHTPDPVPAPETVHPKDDTRDIVEDLVKRVDELTEKLQSLVPGEQDSTPVKRPWTHRKMF